MSNKKIKHLQKQLKFTCPICQTIYQLLEIHQSSNIELLKGKCLNNCLEKWQRTLQDYHSKELMVDINKQEENE